MNTWFWVINDNSHNLLQQVVAVSTKGVERYGFTLL